MNILNTRLHMPNPPTPLHSPPPFNLADEKDETRTVRTQRTEEIVLISNKAMQNTTNHIPSPKRNLRPGETQSDSGDNLLKKQKLQDQEQQDGYDQLLWIAHQAQIVCIASKPVMIEAYFNSINAKMNPNLDPAVDDPLSHYKFDNKRDRWHNMLPSRWLMAKTQVDGVTKSLNANELSYKSADGRILNSSFARSQAPIETRFIAFYHWIMDGIREGKKTYIFNLLSLEEQKDPAKFSNYYSTEKGDFPLSPKRENNGEQSKVNISVTTTDVQEIGLYRTYQLDLKMKNGEEVTKQGKCEVVNYLGLKDTKRAGFIEEFDKFVKKLLAAKHEGNHPVVVHCGAGRGRTGVAIAAAILNESINDNNILAINKFNFKDRVCDLVVELRNHGGGHTFVQDQEGLSLLFDYASYLLEELDN